MKDANNRILLGNRQILSKNSLKQNSSFEMDSLHSLLVMVHISLCPFPPSKCHQKGLPSVASSGEYLLSSRTNERLLVLATTSPIFLPFTCSSTSTIDIVLLTHQIITMFAMTLQSGTSDACTIVLEHLMSRRMSWTGVCSIILLYLVLSIQTSQDISLQHKLSSATEHFNSGLVLGLVTSHGQ